MLKKIMAVGLTALAALAILIGVVAYSYLKPAAAASGPIQAVPIAQASAAPATDSGTTGENTVYTIDQASSKANFVIDEVLNGAAVTVVGTTDQVAGEIALSTDQPERGAGRDHPDQRAHAGHR